MTIGLVIVTYNAEAFIRRALDAVAAQTRLPDAVVIIDNASSDGTWRIVQDATREWSVPVRLMAAGSNLGFAAANNLAVGELSFCELVALLNPDAFPEPGWLAALAEAADAHPEAGSFASRLMLDGWPDTLDGAGDVCHTSGLVWRAGHGRRLSDVPDATRSGPVFSACAAAALYRRTDWVKAGGFDERFFCYAEDVDLGFRLQLAGRPCWYQADAVVDHLGSASTVAGSAFSVYHGHRNLEWLFLKNMPASLIWRYVPMHLATVVVGCAWFTVRGRGGAFIRAKLDAGAGLRHVWRARRLVQASRTISATEVRGLLDRTSLWKRYTTKPH